MSRKQPRRVATYRRCRRAVLSSCSAVGDAQRRTLARWLVAGLILVTRSASAQMNIASEAAVVQYMSNDGLHKCRNHGTTTLGNRSGDQHLGVTWSSAWTDVGAGRCGVAWPPLAPPRCVVATVAVLPVRLAAFRRTLRSMLRQTRPPDKIYVILPRKFSDIGQRLSRRTYHEPLPRWLYSDARVEVLRPETDTLGTLDMVLPTLRALRTKAPDGCTAPHRLWWVNDDAIYDSSLLEELLACAARHPDAACGAQGGRGYFEPIRGSFVGANSDPRRYDAFVVPGGEIEVEWLHSSHGILYRTDFFDESFLTFPADAPREILLEADFWFAGSLRVRGVRLLQLSSIRSWATFMETSQANSLALRWYRVGGNPAKDAAIAYFAKHYNLWREECIHDEAYFHCQYDIGNPSFPGMNPAAPKRVLT